MNQIQSPRSVRPWYVVLLTVVAVAVIVAGITQIGTSTSSAARTSTEDVTAADGVVQSTVSGSGNVEPGVADDVNFQTSGTLTGIDVTVGEHVKKGQLIATLSPSAAELTLAEARTTLAAAEDQLTADEESTTSTSSSSGSGSGSGSSATEASVASVPGKTPTKQKTTSASEPASSKPASTTTTAATTTTASTTTTETAAQVAAHATTVAQAQEQVQADENTVAADEKAVAETKLYAPASGTIASLSSDSVGDTVSAGGTASSSGTSSTGASSSTGSSFGSAASSSASSSSSSSAFAEIINDSTMTMTVSLSEDDITSVKVGQIATVSITALSGVELAGKVTSISPIGTDSSGVVSYDATVTINQSNPKVLPGMSATATIVTGQAQGVTLPTDAVTGSGASGTVEMVKDGKTVAEPVTIGLEGTSRDVITSGLSAGDEVQVTITLPALGTSTTSSTSGTSATGAGGFAALRAEFGGGGGGGFGGGGFGGRAG